VPGTYSLQITLNDVLWNKEWQVYDHCLEFTPFGNITLDPESIGYRREWGYAFLPSALQFHNRQQKKGAVLLSLFTGSAILVGFSGIMWNYYENEMENQAEELKKNGWLPEETAKMNKMLYTKSIYNILTISGIVAGIVIYSYSAVDGLVQDVLLWEEKGI